MPSVPPSQPRRLAALVLRLRPLGESDLMVDLFSREMGRLSALAKGGKRSQKRFFGLLLAAHHLEVDLVPGKQGGLWLMESARLLRHHLGLRQDYRRLLLAGPVLELLLRATAPHDPHPGALDLALLTLARLERASEPQEMASALVIFLTRLLGEQGYGLGLDTCLHCGRPLEAIARPRLSLAGGLACAACPPSPRDRQVPPGLIKSLQSALALAPTALGNLRLSPALLRPALAFLGDFWRHVVGHDLPSLELALEQSAHLSSPFPSRRKTL
ncbi:MAG: DNA repair protein RecO [Pseudomonadota bacterium]